MKRLLVPLRILTFHALEQVHHELLLLLNHGVQECSVGAFSGALGPYRTSRRSRKGRIGDGCMLLELHCRSRCGRNRKPGKHTR